MRVYWIKDRTRQGQFLIYWRSGGLILVTTPPDITRLPITNVCALCFSTQRKQLPLSLLFFCEGVLRPVL